MVYGREEQKKKIMDRANALRDAAAMIPKVKEVVKRFDGKVYNCKLDKALLELNKASEKVRLYSGTSYGDWYYVTAYRKDFLHYDVQILCGYSTKKDASRQVDNGMQIFVDKRIRAEKFIAALDRNYAEIMKKAADLMRAADELDIFCERIESLKKTLSAVKDSVPYEVLDICGIK